MANRSIKRNKRSNKRSYKSKKMYNQRGGLNFNNDQKTRLVQEFGFTQAEITQLEEFLGDMPPDTAMIHIQTDRVNGITPQEIIQSLIDINQEAENIDADEYFNGQDSPKSVVPGNYGGRRRKRRTRKMRGHKQHGGMRYGTGVGSNCFEPNYSIYNTPTLSLFPYKPN